MAFEKITGTTGTIEVATLPDGSKVVLVVPKNKPEKAYFEVRK